MILDTWNFGPLGSYLSGSGTTIILGTVFWLFRRLIQGRAMRKSKAPVKTEAPIAEDASNGVGSKVKYVRVLNVLLICLAATLSVFLLVVVSLLQTSILGLALSIAAGVIAALLVTTALMLGFGVPELESLNAELQVLKGQIKALAQNQQLEGKGNVLEAQLQNVSPEQQLLPLRKHNSPKTKSPEAEGKYTSRRRLLKQAKADVGD